MTDAQFYSSNVDDIINWADTIADEWDGTDEGEVQTRAILAANLIEKANELKDLIAQVSGMKVKICSTTGRKS